MTSVTALPGAGAVLRVARGAAGCRPVRVALLVGGLFVLGVLCGERASAADGAPTSPPLLTTVTQHVTQHVAGPATERVVRPAVERAVRPVAEQEAARPVTEAAEVAEVAGQPATEHVSRPVTEDVLRPVTEVTESAVRPVTESVVRPVTESMVRPIAESVVVPVGDLVESVTEGLGGVTSQLPPVSLPSLPGVPGLPELPELPELPGGTTLPVESLPAPAGVVPQESGPTEAERPGPASDGVGGRDGGRATGPASVAYGPKVVVGGQAVVRVPAPAAADVDGDSAPGVRVPAQQNPDGLPTGTLGRHSAVDNHGPRHAEPHAVAALPSAPMGLVPGAPAADAAGGTRDRHRDIPEFPG